MNNDVQPVISFRNVSKQFAFTGEQPQSILETLISVFNLRRKKQPKNHLWAVRDVSFDVFPGQSMGIIGRNGSGKSTALKLMARILRPSTGRVVVRGRVSALLELGAGFHPDLSGRENIALNASVLGLTEADVARYYDSIVEFSELEEFIDMPVKHYSSGMYMRLGFSVAIHVNPDVLIIDEILGVGDQAFQVKCIDRINELKQKGVTIIMISHNLDVMRKLCTHLIWLEHGQMRASGLTETVAGEYQAYSNEAMGRQLTFETEEGAFKRWGNRDIEIMDVRFLDAQNREENIFQTGDSMCIEINYVAHKAVLNPEFGLAIFRQDGVHLNGPNSRLSGMEMGVVEGAGVVQYQIERLPFLPARYLVTAAVHDSRIEQAYDYHEQAYTFRVVGGGTSEYHGLIEVPATWRYGPASNLLLSDSVDS